MSWIRKLTATLRPARLDDRLDDELEFHIEQRTADLVARGISPAEARRQAALLFGNHASLRESTRDRDVFRWLESTLQDLRFAGRTLLRNPGFACAAVLSLALGIGANTALFSLIDALALRSLPVREPEQLLRVLTNGEESFSYPIFDRLQRGTRLLSSVAATSRYNGPATIEERGGTRTAIVQTVSSNYFDVMGVAARRGRAFHPFDARSAEGGMAVISDAYWRSHYGSEDSALGANFQYVTRNFTIIGIAPPGFLGANVDGPADIWVPLEHALPPDSLLWTKGLWLELLCRPQPGVTSAQAAAEAAALTGRKIAMESGGNGFSKLRTRFSKPLVVLECVVALVLLIACANLANLMLAGAAARQPEMALRQAIGAGRPRLVRQLLTESLLVVALGTTLAIAVAEWLSTAMLHYLPPEAAPALINLEFHLNLPTLGFTLATALLTCLLFGLAPALCATGPSLATHLKQDRGWMNRGLIAVEMAMCTLLLMAAGLFVHSLRNIRTADAGYSGTEHILVADVELPRGIPAEQRRQRMESLRRAVERLPGVQGAGTSHIRPLSGFSINGPLGDIDSYAQHVSPGFLQAMGTPLIAGRDFTDRDDAGAPPVAIVNESFARQFLPGQNPLGRRFGIDIVGVAKDTRWINLRDKPPAMYYQPLAQWVSFPSVIVLRTSGDLAAPAAGMARAARDIDPRIILKDVIPFREMEDRKLIAERMLAQGGAAFGALALLVACIGLYGMLAYSVARRTREIGVRMALGASRAGVQWMVLRESMAVLGAGFAIGVPAALALTRYVESMLFGVSAHDPMSIAAAFGGLAAVALLASWIPARRAASVDPVAALRWE